MEKHCDNVAQGMADRTVMDTTGASNLGDSITELEIYHRDLGNGGSVVWLNSLYYVLFGMQQVVLSMLYSHGLKGSM